MRYVKDNGGGGECNLVIATDGGSDRILNDVCMVFVVAMLVVLVMAMVVNN